MNIGQLARTLENHHKISQSWPETGRAFGISGPMAFRIARQGYEPASLKTRQILNLGPRTCPTCQHRITIPKPVRTWKRVTDLTPADLAYAIAHREELPA